MNRCTRLIASVTTLCVSLICFTSLSLSSSPAHAKRQVTTITKTQKVSRRTRRATSVKRSARRSSARRTAARRVSRQNRSRQNFLASRHHRRSSYRRHYQRSRGRSFGRSRRTVVRHRATRSGVTSSRAGFMHRTLFEVGGSTFAPLKGEVVSGLHLAIGSRLGPVAGVLETQFAQGEHGAELNDINAQLRIYLPLGHNAELYPMVAFGQSHLLSDQGTSHMDLGLGAQFNLTPNFALGARYSARVIAEQIGDVPSNGHNLTAQVALQF